MAETKKPLIYGKMADILTDIGTIEKTQRNAGQGWMFRGIDQFMNALHPILAKHRVVCIPMVAGESKVETIGKMVHIIQPYAYTFYAEDGSSVSGSMLGQGADPGDKAANKAASAALKYALMQTFMVPTEDMIDGDTDNPDLTGRAEQPKSTKKPPAQRDPKAGKVFKDAVDELAKRDCKGWKCSDDEYRKLWLDAVQLSATKELDSVAEWVKTKGRLQMHTDENGQPIDLLLLENK